MDCKGNILVYGICASVSKLSGNTVEAVVGQREPHMMT